MKTVGIVLLAALTMLTPQAFAGSMQHHGDHVQAAAITVTAKGFEPAKSTLMAGMPIKLTVTRITDQTCAKEIVLKEVGIRRTLKLNQPEVIEITAKQLGAAKHLTVVCGMDMITGQIVLE